MDANANARYNKVQRAKRDAGQGRLTGTQGTTAPTPQPQPQTQSTPQVQGSTGGEPSPAEILRAGFMSMFGSKTTKSGGRREFGLNDVLHGKMVVFNYDQGEFKLNGGAFRGKIYLFKVGGTEKAIKADVVIQDYSHGRLRLTNVWLPRSVVEKRYARLLLDLVDKALNHRNTWRSANGLQPLKFLPNRKQVQAQ